MTFNQAVFLLLSSSSCALIVIVHTQHTRIVGRVLRSQCPVITFMGTSFGTACIVLLTVCLQEHTLLKLLQSIKCLVEIQITQAV